MTKYHEQRDDEQDSFQVSAKQNHEMAISSLHNSLANLYAREKAPDTSLKGKNGAYL